MRVDAPTAASSAYRPQTTLREATSSTATAPPRSLGATRDTLELVNTAPPSSGNPPATTPEATETGHQRGRRAHGMLRKLQDGHFNPVADLRHRIKFNVEIQARGIELPELRESHGNGRAYEKFLQIYRALVPESPDVAPPKVQQPVDGEVSVEVPGNDVVTVPEATKAPELPTENIDVPVNQAEPVKPDMTQVFQSLSTYLAQQRIDLIA